MEIIIENKSGTTFKDVDLFSFETLPFPIRVNIKDRVEKFRHVRTFAMKNETGKFEGRWAYPPFEVISEKNTGYEEEYFLNCFVPLYDPFHDSNDFETKGLPMERDVDIFIEEGSKFLMEIIYPNQKSKIVLS